MAVVYRLDEPSSHLSELLLSRIGSPVLCIGEEALFLGGNLTRFQELSSLVRGCGPLIVTDCL